MLRPASPHACRCAPQAYWPLPRHIRANPALLSGCKPDVPCRESNVFRAAAPMRNSPDVPSGRAFRFVIDRALLTNAVGEITNLLTGECQLAVLLPRLRLSRPSAGSARIDNTT